MKNFVNSYFGWILINVFKGGCVQNMYYLLKSLQYFNKDFVKEMKISLKIYHYFFNVYSIFKDDEKNKQL